jgi:hypothetical protein
MWPQARTGALSTEAGDIHKPQRLGEFGDPVQAAQRRHERLSRIAGPGINAGYNTGYVLK